MANPIFTLRDAVDHLREVRFGAAQDVELSILKRAARNAYRDLLDRHKWQYAFDDYQVPLVAPYSTGTLAYVHTGATYERQLTLTTGTWPTWAKYGYITFGSNTYEVEDRKSNSVITLDANRNPGADTTATSYKIYRDTYPLPDDFKRIADYTEASRVWANWYVEPEDWLTYSRVGGISGKVAWTIMADPDNIGGMSLRMAGYPSTAENLLFIYQRAFKEPILAGVETKCSVGTVAVSSYTVTGTSTTLDSTWVDSILSVSADGSSLPTGNDGTNPFLTQHRIKSVESPTNATLYSAIVSPVSGKKYMISDPCDMDRFMLNAFLRGCEYQLVLMGSTQEQQDTKEKQYMSAVRLAQENDWKLLSMRSPSGKGRQVSNWPDPNSISLT